MLIKDRSTPVVILNCKLGALGIMRSLGKKGIALYGVDQDRKSPGVLSRYCKEHFPMNLDEKDPGKLLDYLLKIGKYLGQKAILVWTSDETAVFVSENADTLSEYYLFPKNDPQLIKDLMSKKGMYSLAKKYNIPTPYTEFPQTLNDVKEYCGQAKFPVVLKAIFGNRLFERTGKKMVIVDNENELIEFYNKWEDLAEPNLMLQECIPGGDDEVYIFNGYFDENSDCLNPYTGHKIRQYPVHVGCASLGICKWNEDVAKLTMSFMKEIGYRGILDIGYRLDPRDGKYKVLDINPRIGQAFRMFVSKNNSDVMRDMYLDLTGQKRTVNEHQEGRKWVIEDFDFISSVDYYNEGTLTFGQWIKSFKNLKETAWFYWKDPLPFFQMALADVYRHIKKIFRSSK